MATAAHPPDDASAAEHGLDLAAYGDQALGRTRRRAWGTGENGVHPIPLPEALRRYQALERERPTGAAATDIPAVVWIDIEDPGEDEARLLRDELHLHPLAVEDCLRGRQRPKLERYAGYYFLVLYAARVDAERNRIALNELQCFVGPGFLITVHDQPVAEVRETIARWKSAPDRLRTSGLLAHALIDALVDNYFPVADHLTDEVSAEEARLAEGPRGASSAATVHHIRRELIVFRRVVAPIRDMLGRLMRRDVATANLDLLPYLEDVRDHVIRITEEIDTLHEIVTSLVELHAAADAHVLNQTVRVMTAWSIILMSMTLVAGIYGMNFRHMPELAWRFGYALSLVFMFLIGLVLWTFFRRKRWI